jgi:hypothetical protein
MKIYKLLFLILLAWLTIASGDVLAQKKKKAKPKTASSTQTKDVFAPTNPALPLKISKNGRYFINQYNQPFFLNGDTGWTLLHKLTLPDAIHYLKNRKSKLFNTVFLQLLPPEPGQQNAYNQSPFNVENDFSTPNEAYFQYVENVIKEAAKLRLMVAIVPAWLGCCRTNWFEVNYQNGPDKCRQYGRYLGERFGQYDNLIWIMGGDRDPLREENVQRSIAEGIKAATPDAPMTYHAASSHSSTDVFPYESWLDFSMIYTYFRGKEGVWTNDMPQVYEIAQSEYQKTAYKPFILGESQYEDENVGNSQIVRRQAYWSALTGATGHCYGSSVWAFEGNWKNTLDIPGAFDMAIFYKTIMGLPWELLRPDVANEIIAEGQSEWQKDDYISTAVLPNKRMMVMYMPVARTIKIRADQLRGTIMKILWINPMTGKKTVAGYFSPTGIKEIKPPNDGQDWLLVIGNVSRK